MSQAAEPPPVKPEPNSRQTEAHFHGGRRIQIRRTLDGDWGLWFWMRGGKWRRSYGFVAPTLEDARHTVEEWYGEPAGGWREPQE